MFRAEACWRDGRPAMESNPAEGRRANADRPPAARAAARGSALTRRDMRVDQGLAMLLQVPYEVTAKPALPP